MPDATMIQPHPLNHILVPLDGSRLAETTLRIAIALAERTGGHVTLLHILERNAPATIHGERHLTSAGEAEAYLNGAASRFADAGLPVAIHTHPNPEGDVAASIASHAAEMGADLVILCAHGSGGLRGWFSGAIAQRVIRQTTTPILLVRPVAEGAAVPFAPSGILVALDGSAEGELALPAATAFARTFGARIALAMVVATLGTVAGDRVATARLTPTATSAVLDLESDEARIYLDRLRARLGDEGSEARVLVGRGEAVHELIAESEREHAGVIALATHGRTGLDALWSGSVGAKVVARTANPLLLVPAAGRGGTK
jgi:nucleotide-binding universal stress UspA family protein